MASYDTALDGGAGAWVLITPAPFYGDVRNCVVNSSDEDSSVNGDSSSVAL